MEYSILLTNFKYLLQINNRLSIEIKLYATKYLISILLNRLIILLLLIQGLQIIFIKISREISIL